MRSRFFGHQSLAGAIFAQRWYATTPPKDDAEPTGFTGTYSQKGADAYRSMLTTSPADALNIDLPNLPGKATRRGTQYTIERSAVFENWFSELPDPAGWFLSKLGCATCKMTRNVPDAVDSLQLQIVKGLNVFMLEASVSEAFQHISRGFSEALNAFELDREGFVFVARAGIMLKSHRKEGTGWELNNVSAIRRRLKPTVNRVQSGSLPSMSAKGGFDFENMTDTELSRLHLRRLTYGGNVQYGVAATHPEWLEAALTNMAAYTRLETIDVFFIEGLQALLLDPNMSEEEIDAELVETFRWCEQQVAHGVLQYYGVSSSRFYHQPFKWPEFPKDAMLPSQVWELIDKPPQPIDLHRIMRAAKKAGGERHHLRFISYPFNLTMSQPLYTKLHHDPAHTLKELARHYGLGIITHSPLEAPDMLRTPQRYHRFPLLPDLATGRLNFFNLLEKTLMKEREIQSYVEKLKNPPNLQNIFLGSVYAMNQRQFSNLFQFQQFMQMKAEDAMRQELSILREGAARDIKDWANNYEQMVLDMMRHRQMLFEHKHGLKAMEIDASIDRIVPKLGKCPIFSQKALNFATYGGDCTLSGFHQTRYFHEATELNPAKNGELPLTEEEVKALCEDESVTHWGTNPPHPYMMEPLASPHQGKMSGQKSPSLKHMKEVDLKNPEWPDIAKRLDEREAKVEAHKAQPPKQAEEIPDTDTPRQTMVDWGEGPGKTPAFVDQDESRTRYTKKRFF